MIDAVLGLALGLSAGIILAAYCALATWALTPTRSEGTTP